MLKVPIKRTSKYLKLYLVSEKALDIIVKMQMWRQKLKVIKHNFPPVIDPG